MSRTVGPTAPGGLERSGTAGGGDSIRFGAGAPGLERATVFLRSGGFEPHRHDRYALGITTAGVQVFRYRGAHRVCLPGQLHVLHPDELHDGGPGTEDGFSYRIVYVAPDLVRAARPASALPWVADPVQDGAGKAAALAAILAELLGDIDEPVSDLGQAAAAVAIADGLAALAAGGHRPRRAPAIDQRAVDRVRDRLLVDEPATPAAVDLERVSGLDRYTLVRHFRAAFGTTPDRYRRRRRLDRARRGIERGEPLARVAADAGFADQSHLTRQFKQTYGLTPGRWAALTGADGPG
jgi:AraC-like DNA-binding protein